MRRCTPPAGMIGAILALLLGCGPAGALDSRAADPGYRTIVVFGDTQALVHRRDPALGRMVDWVIAQRDAENIDAVLHVGDAINTGQECHRLREPLPASCTSEQRAKLRAQWDLFNGHWQRLERVLPAVLVRGNHDNSGWHAGGPRGYLHHYGRERLGASPPVPGYLESCPAADADRRRPWLQCCIGRTAENKGIYDGSACLRDVAHLYRIDLGPLPVLVVGLSNRPDRSQIDWARERIAAHALPTILVAHGQATPMDRQRLPHTDSWDQLVAGPRGSPQIFMTAQGHLIGDYARVVPVGGRNVFTLLFNQQRAQGPQARTLALVRFWIRDGRIAEVEKLSFDPVARRPLGPALPRQPF